MTDGLIILTPLDLAFAACLMLLLTALSWRLHLGIGRQMLIAGARSVVQLLLLGLVLKALFASSNPWLIGALATLMLAVAGIVSFSPFWRRKHLAESLNPHEADWRMLAGSGG